MALNIGAGGCGATSLYGGSNGSTYGGQQFLRRPILFPPPQPTSRNANLITKASKKWSPRTGKLDGKNRRSSTTTTKEEEEEEQRTVLIGTDGSVGSTEAVDVSDGDDGYFLPELPGLEKDFWEGPEWDGFGFFMQYMWAFGIGFARSGSWRASVELMGKELKASVLFSKRQRQPGCWSLNCFSPTQQGWAGEGAVPWTNGAHGTNGSRRVPQSAIVGPADGMLAPPGFCERAV